MKKALFNFLGIILLCLMITASSQAGQNARLVQTALLSKITNRPTDEPQGAGLELPNNCVRAVTCDASDNCWFPTWGGVAVRSADGNWTDFTTQNSGIAHSYCLDVAVDDLGLVWITHHEVGVSLLDTNGTLFDKTDDRWLIFTPQDGLGSGFMVETIEIDPQGRKWFGHGNGISILDDHGTPFDKSDDLWTEINNQNSGLIVGPINTILFDPAGCIWAGGDFGLSRKCGGSWEALNWSGEPNCLECCWSWPQFVWQLALDQEDHVWVADGGCGAAMWDGAQWTIYDSYKSGLPAPQPNASDAGVRAVAIDAPGNLWFGTRGRGVARLSSGDQWTLFTSEDDWLGSNSIEGIDFDQQGTGWFGSCGDSGGVYSYRSPTNAVITAEAGGTLSSPDGRLKTSFPPQAVESTTIVTYTQVISKPAGGYHGVYFFDLSASGLDGIPVTHFNQPYTLTVQYSDAGRGPTVESSLALYWWQAGQWVKEPTSQVDISKNLIIAAADHMTTFSVLGEVRKVFLPFSVR